MCVRILIYPRLFQDAISFSSRAGVRSKLLVTAITNKTIGQNFKRDPYQ